MIALVSVVGIIKMIPWIAGVIGGMYATKKVTEAFKSPINDVNRIPGIEKISPKQLYNEAKEYKKDRIKYHEKRDKKIQGEIDELNKQIEKLQEEKTKVGQQMEVAKDDPKETIRLQAVLDKINKDLVGLTNKVNQKENEKKEVAEKIDEVFEKLGDIDNTTQEQFIAKASSFDWTSVKNYGLLSMLVIIAIMVLVFLRKIFNNILVSMK
jgi:predicted RNase H-like nuclease (RuvC/YqgF family)